MCLSERYFSRQNLPHLGQVGQRLGTRQALLGKGFPNLPNLPHLVSRVHVGAHMGVCRRMHRQACARACVHLTLFTLGRLGRLGTALCHKGFQLPNLCLPSARWGT